MLYRLTFDFTIDGHLRVTGVTEGLAMVSATHLNDKAFATAVKSADIAPFQMLRLLEAARQAKNQPGTEICCEVVELNQKQLELISANASRKS